MCGTLIYRFVSSPGGRVVWYEDASTERQANSLLWRLWMWPNSPRALASAQKVKRLFSPLGDDCDKNWSAVTFPELRIHIQCYLMCKHWTLYIELEMNVRVCVDLINHSLIRTFGEEILYVYTTNSSPKHLRFRWLIQLSKMYCGISIALLMWK